MAQYSLQEMMVIIAAREVKNSDIVLCGTGISMLAAIAAKKITAPEASIFFETGAVDVQFAQIPLSLADPRIMQGAIKLAGLAESFNIIQNRTTGRSVISILGAAQVDIYGNLNSTAIGEDYRKPKVRFSGSGGACDIGSLAGQFWIFMELGKRRFVEQVDYLTTPGFLDGPGAREKLGLPGGGPTLVITDKACFRFDDTSKKMYLHSCYPGFTAQAIQDEIGFKIDLTRASEAKPPTEHELHILRTQCDPDRMVLKGHVQ
jgi:glutaconate CoA-transferase subunit B